LAKASETLYYVVIGVLLILAGAWAYSSAQAPLSADQLFSPQPLECQGLTFLVDPAGLVVRGEARALGFYVGDKSMTEMARTQFDFIILNDPCRDGYANVVVVSGGAASPPVNVSLEGLAALVAPAEALEGLGARGAAVTGLGVRPAAISEAIDFAPGAVAGSMYYVVTTTYYDAETGVLLKRDALWVKAAGLFTPDVVYTTQETGDLLKQTGEGLVSYQRAVAAAMAYTLAAGVGIVAGAISLAYAARTLLED